MKNDPYTQDVVEVFEKIMDGCGTNYSKTAAMIVNDGKPMSRQAIFKMVKQGSLKLSLFFRVMDMLGVDVVFVKDGEQVWKRLYKF